MIPKRRYSGFFGTLKLEMLQDGCFLDAHPTRLQQLVARPEGAAPVPVVHRDVERHTFARLPPVRLHVGRCGCLRAVVAERLLAVGEVEPDRRAPRAIGETDAGLPERRALTRHEAAAAREHGGRRAAVGAE